MDNKKLQQKNKLLYSVISLGCLLALVVFSIFMMPGSSLSWFSKNEKLESSGISVNSEKYPLKVEYAADGEEFSVVDWDLPLNFLQSTSWYPGYSVVFKIKVTNVGNSPVCVDSFGFSAPTEQEETARTVGEEDYYLGTQLSAAVTAINDTTLLTPEEHRLLSVQDGKAIREDLTIYQDTEQSIKLQPTESIRLTVRLTFVNEDFSQDMYKNFGKSEDSPERCQRRFFVGYSSIN